MERRQPMEQLNLEILEALFTWMPLRGHLDRENTARLKMPAFLGLIFGGIALATAPVPAGGDGNKHQHKNFYF